MLLAYGCILFAEVFSTSSCVWDADSETACRFAGTQKRSFLLILDASSMQEVARAWTKDPVALGFHGHFGQLDEFKHATSL